MKSKKRIKLYLGLITLGLLSACNGNINEVSTSAINDSASLSEDGNSNPSNVEELEMKLTIDNHEVNVSWENNESVKALKRLTENPLTIDLSMYGGFEQVGSIGHTLPSNDTRITTNPGDIVLYSSDQIVLFYGSNTWSYTKLGHINLEKNELVELLGKQDVTISLTSEH